MENLGPGILEDAATAAQRRRKLTTLGRAEERLARLRVFLRLCHELGLLSREQYEDAAVRLQDAGKMLGAWIKRQRAAEREWEQEWGQEWDQEWEQERER